jgi:hypothetical protein
MSKEKRPEDREELAAAKGLGADTPPALKAFEAALASLIPRADRLDRDRLMFLAGQESRVIGRVEQAHRSPANRPVTADGGASLRLTHPAKKPRWAWPVAFTAMTAVAAVLAVLLAIRPTVPADGSNRESLVASDGKPLRDAQAQERPLPRHWEPEPDDRVQPFSPLFAFIQSLWNTGDAGSGADAASPVHQPLASTYPRLRNDLMHPGIESWHVAQSFSGTLSAGLPESPANRALLKQYLPESN